MSRPVPPPFSSSSAPFCVVARQARALGDKKAIICGQSELTYRRLADRAAKVTQALQRQGVKPGERIGVTTENTVDHLVGLLSAMAAGAIAVSLSPDVTSSNAIIEDAGPVLILETGSGESSTSDAHPSVLHVDVEELATRPGSPDLALLERSVTPDEIAMLYYTSGTSSGVRKGVMQSYGQLHNTVYYITDIMKMDGSIIEFVASPTDNAFWFGRCRCLFHVGGTAILSSGTLNPLSIVSQLNRHGGNAIGGDTAVYMLLLNHMEKHLARIGPSIRWAKVASAPMPVDDKQRLMGYMPNAWIVMNYGLTEAMRTCLHPFRESPDKLDTVGQPCPSVRLRIGRDGGTEAPAGEIGEVLIGGGNLASGYWRNRDLWENRFRSEWYHSGDLGFLDKEGFLHLRGRIDHAINSGGKTIALSEVENLLRQFLPNTNYAACGMNDPKAVLGEVVALCVEGEWKEPQPWSKLRIALFEAMEPLLVPVSAYALPQLPRTSNGKVQLNVLREQIEGGRYPAL